MRIAKGDKWKTTFCTHYGLFEWLMMLFGLSNAPSAFQRFMNDIFSDVLDVFVVIYLDDILIYSDNMDDHKKHVKEILKRLRENWLYASPTKYVFHRDRIKFLGFVLGVDGLRIDKSKTQTIQNWPTLRRVKDVQSFLGFANFYRHFIDNYAEITSPLTCLTWKNEPWSWTTDCQVVFDNIKEAFTIAPILGHWDPESLMILETNASDCVLAAILFTWSNGEIRPIAFYSRAFSAAEINYDVHDKELLAIVESFKKWRHYLKGVATPVEVYTDHKNLTYFSETKTLSQCLARWSEFLSQFNLSIKFWPGRLGKKPDALTQR